MKKMELKRKIYNCKTLEQRLVRRKLKISPFVQVKPERVKKAEIKKIKKDKKISTAVRLFSVSCC